MTDPLLAIVERYASRGIIVDSNLLLLYFVGMYDRGLVERFKRTRMFTCEDHDTLVVALDRFAAVITTPNILTEVSNLSGHLAEPLKREYFRSIVDPIRSAREDVLPSRELALKPEFVSLGLTDTSIAEAARIRRAPVLTVDLDLYLHLLRENVDAVNFNHYRRLN